MLEISAIVKEVEELFDLFKGYFYNEDFNRSIITVSPDGWCSVQEVWKAENEVHREINLCAEYLSSEKTENKKAPAGDDTSTGAFVLVYRGANPGKIAWAFGGHAFTRLQCRRGCNNQC